MNRLHIDSAGEKNCLHSPMTLIFGELFVSLYTRSRRHVNVLLIRIIERKVSRLFLDLSDVEPRSHKHIISNKLSPRISSHSNDLFLYDFYFRQFKVSTIHYIYIVKFYRNCAINVKDKSANIKSACIEI